MAITAPPVPSTAVELYDVLDRLGSLGPTGDPRMCTALLRAVSTVEGLALREVAAVDAYGSHVEVGQPSAAALVQAAVDCTQAVASGTVRLARRLASDLRPVGDLLIAGRLTRRHCAAVVHGVRGLDANIVTNSLDAICNLAVVTDPDTLARELRLRAEAISPTLADHARARLEDRIGLSCSDSPDGTGHLSATISPETVALLNAVLDATVHGARIDGDSRSTPRRRHDALLDLLRHAADCTGLALPSQGGCRAQITIIATAATVCGADGAAPARLVGSLHGLLTREAFLRMCCDADISTAHLNADLASLELSRLSRTVSTAQWRALIARDQHCVARGCHRPPSQCQAHHVIHWANGGPTNLDNLVLLCHSHHHQLHDQQRWLSCTHNRTMTAAGWLDDPADNPLTETGAGQAAGRGAGPPS